MHCVGSSQAPRSSHPCREVKGYGSSKARKRTFFSESRGEDVGRVHDG